MSAQAALVSAYDLAPILGVREPRKVSQVLSRAGVEPSDKAGRVHLYRLSDVIERTSYGPILQSKATEVAQVAIRKSRSDRGAQRKRNQAAVDYATKAALTHYLSSGMPDARFACEAALRQMLAAAAAGEITATVDEARAIDIEWFYKRYIMRRDEYFQGPFYAGGWRDLWKARYRQHEVALTAPHSRREMYKIFESAGWAGEGYGFGAMVVLDDRSADVWTTEDGETFTMPNGIYAWDVLTGSLLWVTPLAGDATTQAYVQTIICMSLYWSLAECPNVILENARAAKSVRIDHMVTWLYSPEALGRVASDRNLTKLFNGQTGPVYRNVPHIAREIGKAFAERSFGVIKREHDARFSSDTFQGGNRDEAVQMHRSNTPWFHTASTSFARHAIAKVPELASYFESLWGWAQGDYLERERASLKPWAKDHGLVPTRRAMGEYYGRAVRTEIAIPNERMACAIYLATEGRRRICKVGAPGFIRVAFDGRMTVIASAKLTPDLRDRKIGVVEMPMMENHYILVLLSWKKDVPERLVDIAPGRVATTIDEDIQNRQDVRDIRMAINRTADERVKAALDVPLLPPSEPAEALPQAPGWVSALDAPSDASEGTETADSVTPEDLDDDELNSILNL